MWALNHCLLLPFEGRGNVQLSKMQLTCPPPSFPTGRWSVLAGLQTPAESTPLISAEQISGDGASAKPEVEFLLQESC